MKKLLSIATLLLVISLTSCETDEIRDDELTQISKDIEPTDDGTIDDGDTDEESKENEENQIELYSRDTGKDEATNTEGSSSGDGDDNSED